MLERRPISERLANPEGLFTFPTKPMTLAEVLEEMRKQGLDQADIDMLEKFNYGLQNEKFQEEGGRIAPRDNDIEGEVVEIMEPRSTDIAGEFKRIEDSDK